MAGLVRRKSDGALLMIECELPVGLYKTIYRCRDFSMQHVAFCWPEEIEPVE
jgi:hypothetical protein